MRCLVLSPEIITHDDASGGRTKQLDIFCRVTGFTSDFLSFIDVELIRFFHGALQLSVIIISQENFENCTVDKETNNITCEKHKEQHST